MRDGKTILCLLFLVFGASELEAQRLGRAPKKGPGTFVADSNDAMALYDYGLEKFATAPETSADAFYWAARINPAYAEPLYGRRVALLASNSNFLRRYMERSDRNRAAKEFQHIDSLFFQALNLNPFLFQRLDRELFRLYVLNSVEENARRSGDRIERGEMDYYVSQWLSSATYEMKGWALYSEANFEGALRLYGMALPTAREKAPLRIDRARIFGMRGYADSAIAEFQAALTEMRAKDDKKVVVLYNSKALLEHSIAMLLEQRNDAAGAREAYGRALQEDLSFYPAHLRLGQLAFTQGDTAAGISELELAVQLAPSEPWPVFSLGGAQLLHGQVDAAIDNLKKAIDLEPRFALPHVLLGNAFERKGDKAAATAAYQSYLDRSARRDPRRPEAQARLAGLKSGAASPD